METQNLGGLVQAAREGLRWGSIWTLRRALQGEGCSVRGDMWGGSPQLVGRGWVRPTCADAEGVPCRLRQAGLRER